MGIKTDNSNQKNKISLGLIITMDQLNNSIFPKEVLKEISNTPYYLLIFISREDVVKISCFPTKTNNIKKVLIKLTEFSPDLVKGISTVLRELDLSKYILHTTGLCYEMEKCFYETYIIGENLDPAKIEIIKKEFNAIMKVIDVNIEEIPILNK
ncbi:MAG: hypothetical protein ACFFAH_13175 [Promethearchaeota archaeon]